MSKHIFVEVKSLQGSWDDNDIILSRAQFEKAQKRKRIIYFIYNRIFRFIRKTRNYPIENPIRFFQNYSLIMVGKILKSNSNENPKLMTSFYMKITNIKLKIKKIGSGSKIRLFFKNHNPLIFNKNTMKVISE